MKLTRLGLGSFIISVVLLALALGTTFKIDLVTYGLYILLAAAFLLIHYVQASWLNWKSQEEISFSTQVMGLAGIVLLSLFLGIQVPISAKYSWIGAGMFALIGLYGEWRGENSR